MIRTILAKTEELLASHGAEKLPEDGYTHMRYPKLLPLMNFEVQRYRIGGFGSVFSMHTTTKMGMELLTLSFTPGEGKALPYLLLDSMSMKKKRCVFVEYYACGKEDLNDAALRAVWKKYKDLPAYEEKPGWYIAQREPYSLIRSGEPEQLSDMAADSVRSYLDAIADSPEDPAYPEMVKEFRERMIRDGNPSSKTLEMLLKKDGAERFMREAVMPIP